MAGARTLAAGRRVEIAVEPGAVLVGDLYGAGERGAVILAHGGGQTRHAWAGTARLLAGQGWRALAVDLRGHGESSWPACGDYSVPAFGRDLAAVARFLGGRPALVGASLGGLAGLAAELSIAPGVFSSITLVDITTRMEASGIEKIAGFMREHVECGFDSLEAAAQAISRYLPHRPQPKDLSGLGKNLRLGEDGRYRWHWDPRFITTGGGGAGERERVAADLDARLHMLRVPVHLIRGRMSEVVTEEAARAFVSAIPGAVFTDVAGAGHMVAGDRNDAFSIAVADFLAEVEAGEPSRA